MVPQNEYHNFPVILHFLCTDTVYTSTCQFFSHNFHFDPNSQILKYDNVKLTFSRHFPISSLFTTI